MVSNINNALSAYQAALGRISNVQSSSSSEGIKQAENSFGNVLKNVVEEAVDTQKKAEMTTIQGIKGQADIQDVVLAIANAEQALETVVAVRDTAIRAYNSIMQMNI
ncbi:MAG: flagellar hook-basal body complex protein FliE [Alphaproteobacteria bacterium]|nr:flagellar hook-basal body complex protein FliE [Alphaproteobacteria bacterium]